MLKTTPMLLERLSGYAWPANRLARLVAQGKLTRVVNGLYETDRNTPGHLLAGSIYGPSYLSFSWALAFYGLIPEAVYVFTSATFSRKKRKQYTTPFGTFTYRDVPERVYPLGIRVLQEGKYTFHIASPEKALCDQLYALPKVHNRKDLLDLLFEDQRIDTDDFAGLNRELLLFVSARYPCTNVRLLHALLLKGEQ